MKKITTFIKIFCLVLFNYVIFQNNNPLLLTSILVMFIVILMPTNYRLLKRLKTIVPIAGMIILFQLIFNTLIPLSSRFFLGYMAAVRLVTVSLSILLFLTATSLNEFVQFLTFLPKKVVLVIIMTCYFIPGIVNESEKINAVQKSRGMNSNNFHIVTNLASLIVPLLHRVFQRAETLSMNILARGYEE